MPDMFLPHLSKKLHYEKQNDSTSRWKKQKLEIKEIRLPSELSVKNQQILGYLVLKNKNKNNKTRVKRNWYH